MTDTMVPYFYHFFMPPIVRANLLLWKEAFSCSAHSPPTFMSRHPWPTSAPPSELTDSQNKQFPPSSHNHCTAMMWSSNILQCNCIMLDALKKGMSQNSCPVHSCVDFADGFRADAPNICWQFCSQIIIMKHFSLF